MLQVRFHTACHAVCRSGSLDGMRPGQNITDHLPHDGLCEGPGACRCSKRAFPDSQWRVDTWKGLQLRPRDLPRLRDEIVRFGAGDIGQAMLQIDVEQGRVRPHVATHTAERMRLATQLANAVLFYVTDEMCALVDTAAAQLPAEFEMSIDDPPATEGFVWLSGQIMDHDTEGNRFDIRGFSWTSWPGGMRLAIYVERDAMSDGLKRKLQILQFPDAFPIGSVDLNFNSAGVTWVSGMPGDADTGRPAYSWIKAFWLLTRQPLAEQDAVLPDRAERRRAARQGRPEPPPVRLIRLRRQHGSYAGKGHPGQWYHQWVVRGHWRMQPWGPGRQYRRPVWISPFVKGPEGAPLLGGEKVYVVDDGGTG